MAKNRILVAALGVAVVTLTLVGCGAQPYSGDTTGCEVTDKAAIGRMDSEGTASTDYRIYTTCGTFAVQDDPLLGQWNSADLYGQIRIGEVYDFEAYGWRNGFMSTFPNIKSAGVSKAGF